jgi:peptidylprolyl isomerase
MPRKLQSSARKSRRNRNTVIAIGLLAVVVVAIVVFFVFGQSSPSNNNIGDNSTGLSNNSNSTSSNGPTKVLLQTTMGNITIELRDDMPITAGNFKNLVQQKVYDGTIFHRVIKDFMIQGGDPTGTGYGDPSIPTIKDEFTPDNHNVRGTIAMANTGQPDSGSSQFFINTVDNGQRYASFDSSYPVFGKVIQGMDVVDAISNVATGSNDKPIVDVMIIKAEILP